MTLNIAALVFFGMCWGASVPLLKFAIGAGHHPLGMMIWQLAVSVAVLGAVIVFRSIPVAISRRNIVYLFFIAIIGTLVPNSFSLMATEHLPGGIMAIVIAMVPIVSLLIALLFRIESFALVRFSGVVLGVVALLLIALPDTALPDPGKAPWILVAIIAPVCYAIEGNFVAVRAPENLNAVSTLFGASVVGLVLLLPVVYLNGWQVPVLLTWDGSRVAMIFAAVGHMIAYTGYLWLLGRTGAVFTSQVAYIVTLTGVLGSAIFLGESYHWLVWVALILMMIALTMVRPVHVKRSAEYSA